MRLVNLLESAQRVGGEVRTTRWLMLWAKNGGVTLDIVSRKWLRWSGALIIFMRNEGSRFYK